MIKGLNLFFAFCYFLSEFISPIEVFTDFEILSELFDFLKLSLNLDQFFIEDLLLILQFF